MDITIFINENSSRRMDFIQARTKNELVSSSPGFLSPVKDNFIAVYLTDYTPAPFSSCATLSDKPGFRKLQRRGTGKSMEKKKEGRRKKRTSDDTNIHYLES